MLPSLMRWGRRLRLGHQLLRTHAHTPEPSGRHGVHGNLSVDDSTSDCRFNRPRGRVLVFWPPVAEHIVYRWFRKCCGPALPRQATAAYISLMAPQWIVLENVTELGTAPPGFDPDTITIVEELKRMQYAAVWQLVSAPDHGSPARRDRLYLLGFRATLPDQIPALMTILSEAA